MITDEIWKTIPNFSNYQVSNKGRARNKKLKSRVASLPFNI